MAKGPKLLNPADKARKEARRKELKKNKKQRQQVRSAAIEKKDPIQVIADLEKLDRFEFDVATMNDVIYKDKRRRLWETWVKILAYYSKEDPERHAKLKKLENEYEAKHKKLAKNFEAIKAAQEVKIEDIFLPLESDSAIDDIADDDPLLSNSVYVTPLTDGIEPPGCPPGLPPDLKQLVDSLKTSLVASTPVQPQPIPPILMNSHTQSTTFETSITPHQPYRQRPRADADHNRNGHHNFKQPMDNYKKPEALKNEIRESSTGLTKKTTVIESKPVIIKPKATRFVPSSLRSKLIKK